ncbi:MAG TPA: lysylphosphatidylglycerol synthase transmembrane domain-containing protein, partial [Acidimicrobiales bacterium]|nr:lysylphosphatidylglycerol synthase transmembrane domain-containing protein [Acidimicrobiales bacterium]
AGGRAPGAPVMHLRPVRRQRSPADVLRLLLGLLLLALGLLLVTVARNTVGGAEADIVEAYERIPDRVAEALTALAFVLAVALPLLALVVLLLGRRYRRAVALLVGSVTASWAMVGLDRLLTDRGVLERVREETGGEVVLTDPRFATSSLLASTVAMVVIASPWLSQRWRRSLWGLVAFLVVLRMVSSGEPAFDVVLALAVGMVVGSAVLVAVGTPSTDPDAAELTEMLRLRRSVTSVTQLDTSDPLAYRLEMADGPPLALSVRTSHDRSADLLARLWRYVRLRTSETDRPFASMQRRIEHEALAQTLAAERGVRVPAVHGIVASEGGAVGVVTDVVEGTPAPELAVDEMAAGPLVDAWRQVSRLHEAGIAHRALGLRRFTVTDDGRAELHQFDDARLAAPDADLGRDVAQLLVATAVVVGPERAVAASVAALGRDRVTAALPYLQPLALPGSTRRALRKGERNVLGQLREAARAATGAAEVPLARLQRLRPRTIVTIVAVAAAFYVMLPQLADVQRTAGAAADADWRWLIPAAAASAATYPFAALSLLGSVAQPVPFVPTLRMQAASSFVSRIAPASTGSIAVGVRFLQRAGVEPAAAATSIGLNTVAGFVLHMVLLAAFLAWTGTSGVGGFNLPDVNVALLVIAGGLLASGLVIGLVPALRRRVVPPAIAQARKAVTSLASVVTDPRRLLALLGGSAGVTLAYILCLAATVYAFGGGVGFPEIGAAYLVAAAVGSVAPTPGGLGAFEATAIAALQGYGMHDGRAIAAVLTFRLLTFWLPVLPGWGVFQYMQRRDEL